MPLLRIDQSDLKCKNGCDYYGNPQWQGYCSICHREQMQRQRRAEKVSSATLPKPESKRQDKSGVKLTSHSSFSKFEKKRQHQSDTLKKANLLKFSVFKKSNTDDHERESTENKIPEFKIPSSVLEDMKKDFRKEFPGLNTPIDRDTRVFVQTFIMDVIKNSEMNAEDLSERVQRQYQRYMKHMDTSQHYSHVDSETKEAIMDFVEKHAMSYLHDLPSIVFSPSNTDDERADRAMSDRIQQLGWVCETHLECNVDRNNVECRQLLYRAIGELLGMDSARSPGGKLSRVRGCCAHVLALVSTARAPAAADDLLPALILTVLKANPPRLRSNINFVSRFCNANRLMTGEGGYYFTNLCCAVEFIEKMTAEQLNMDKEEFDCYMSMPASIGGSSWSAALSLSAEAREAEELSAAVRGLAERARHAQRQAELLDDTATTFLKEISNKVDDVLNKTPLEILPRRELPRFGKSKCIKTAPLIDLETNLPPPTPVIKTFVPESLLPEQTATPSSLGFEVLEKPTESPPKTNRTVDPVWELKQTSSLELLTPSPSGFGSFDTKSIDDILTPDEFTAPGLSNINYDLDLSDLSGENSVAEDVPKHRDPFSPEGLVKNTSQLGFDPFTPVAPRDPFSPIIDNFNQFSFNTPLPSSSFNPEPFSPFVSSEGREKNVSILDDSDCPTVACLLPSPLQPQNTSNANGDNR